MIFRGCMNTEYEIDVSSLKLICGASAKFYYLQPGVHRKSKTEAVSQFTSCLLNKKSITFVYD